MAERSDCGGWFGLGVGLGILIGGFFTALILKSRDHGSANQTMQPVYQQPPPVNVYPGIKEKLPAAPELPKIIESPKPQIQEPLTALTTYKNNEKWEITRGPDGTITALNVIRDAKVNAPA